MKARLCIVSMAFSAIFCGGAVRAWSADTATPAADQTPIERNAASFASAPAAPATQVSAALVPAPAPSASASTAAPASVTPPAPGPATPPAAAPEMRPRRQVRSAAPPWGPAGPPLQSLAPEPCYGIAMPWDERSFESFRASYLSPDGKKWLEAVMERARPYFAYISDRLRYYNLPEELAFLPVVESEYSPKAVSKSGAAGLWQFMRNSIAGYGIRIDDWVDERRDFMKSSDGALRKLADNYAEFGDWDLAVAAFNAGDGAVARALFRAKKEGIVAPDYWDLRARGLLPVETASYVPKFLAIASILRYPGRFGLSLSWDSPPEWEAIEPGRPVDLAILAKAAGIDLGVLRQANPELRYGVTPPSESYRLKVPADDADSVKAVLDDKSLALVRYYLHTVRSGDTLSALSRDYGAPISTILQSNPGLRADLLRIGQVIVVPALRNAPPPPPPPPPRDNLAFSGSYTVVKGDTLWSISLRYDIQPEVLAERNGLGIDSMIREGMTLRVPIVN
ncbi:MAG: LysM peptidoglycan-binding domain-containing protein [Treponema sp.]|nr:LysM peptidoglycan-binding domain-containing protein [Treponema sp.]